MDDATIDRLVARRFGWHRFVLANGTPKWAVPGVGLMGIAFVLMVINMQEAA